MTITSASVAYSSSREFSRSASSVRDENDPYDEKWPDPDVGYPYNWIEKIQSSLRFSLSLYVVPFGLPAEGWTREADIAIHSAEVAIANYCYAAAEAADHTAPKYREVEAYEALSMAKAQDATVADCNLMDTYENSSEIFKAAIWLTEPVSEFSRLEQRFLQALQQRNDLSFWARWYERMASGNPMNWEMQKEIALIPDEDWKQGAVHVSKLIAEIEAKYATQTLPLAEDLEVDGDGRVYTVPVPVPQGDVYAEALEAVQDALDDALLGDNQALKSDDLEARILSRTLEKYRETPYRVHQDFTIVRDNLRGKLGDVFAQDHAPIVNLIRAVDDGAVNIRRAVPRVRETLKANAWVRLKDASPEEREAILALLSSIEAIAREDFAQDLAEDRVQIAAPTSEAEVADALYRTGNRAAKIRQMVIDGTIRGSTGLIAGTALGEAIVMILRLLGL